MPGLKNKRFGSHREHRGHGENTREKNTSIKKRRFSSHGGHRGHGEETEEKAWIKKQKI